MDKFVVQTSELREKLYKKLHQIMLNFGTKTLISIPKPYVCGCCGKVHGRLIEICVKFPNGDPPEGVLGHITAHMAPNILVPMSTYNDETHVFKLMLDKELQKVTLGEMMGRKDIMELLFQHN